MDISQIASIKTDKICFKSRLCKHNVYITYKNQEIKQVRMFYPKLKELYTQLGVKCNIH